jgi:Rho-binding antiterminator
MTNTSYTPINCDSYDILLANATLKKKCNILHTDIDGNTLKTEAVIVDVYTKTKEEFIQLDNGVVIRLDKIISVDGETIYKNCDT